QYVDAQIIAHVDTATETPVSPAVAGGNNVQTSLQGLKALVDTKPDVGYMSNQDALRVSKSGDTMTGLLLLSADPTALLGAATKQYVDALIATLEARIAALETP